MAKSNWGITSGFVGKLGNVVGFNWKGKNIQRALVINSPKVSTQAQILHRTRFAMVTGIGGDLYEAVYEGYRREAREGRTTQNGLFMKDNLDNIMGSDPELLVVDFGQLQLSKGKLRGVDFGQAAVDGNVLSVSVAEANLIGRRTSANDRIYLCAYCPELRDARCQSVGTRTSEGTLTLNLPASWSGKRIYTYAFVVGAAPCNDGQASKTVFLGAFGTESGGNTGANTGSDTPGGNSGNGGSSSGSETVAAPTISGTTHFTESTQVTISGPDGSAIHYTTDGSTPTAESTRYSAAITLTDTTTVKAIAIKDNVTSTVASKTFTKTSGGGGDAPSQD